MMDLDSGSPNSMCESSKSSTVVDGESVGKVKEEGEEEGESNSLLGSGDTNGRRGAMAKRQKSSKRKVQWNDRKGNKLVEVLEFQPRFCR